jgi:hypothetical protein
MKRGCLVVLGALILFFSGCGYWLFRTTPLDDQRFDPKEWQATDSSLSQAATRLTMTGNLLQHVLKRGDSATKVQALLGKSFTLRACKELYPWRVRFYRSTLQPGDETRIAYDTGCWLNDCDGDPRCMAQGWGNMILTLYFDKDQHYLGGIICL